MEDQFSFLIFGMIMLAVIIVALIKTNQFENRIAKEVRSKGFTPITISRRWLDWDEGTASFDVVYQDKVGIQHQTRCKIRSYMYIFDGDLYWTRPLVDQTDEKAAQMRYEEKRSILIDGLRAENQTLKDRIQELENQLASKKLS